jgi:hypothetical protein
MLGTDEKTRAFLAKRLDEARTAWQERRYNPDLVPELERDPFETPEEFAARIGERPWYVGEGALQKAGYDIKTGRFPLEIQSPLDWAGRWLGESSSYRLILARDPARSLYRRSPTWPLYVWLLVHEGQASCERLVLMTPEVELTVEKGTGTVVEQTAASVPETVRGMSLGRYRDLGDGTVLDPKTGLQWMRGALGQTWNGNTCMGEPKRFRWDEIFGQTKDFNRRVGFAGHRDWRVPTIEELKTLIVEGTRPAIDQQAFPGAYADRWIWSSSPYAYYSNHAWIVKFYGGSVGGYGKGDAYHVRLVRGGQ